MPEAKKRKHLREAILRAPLCCLLMMIPLLPSPATAAKQESLPPDNNEKSFWLNVDGEAGTFEVTYSKLAGVPSLEMFDMSDEIYQSLNLFAISHGDGSHRNRVDDWNKEGAKNANTNGHARGPAHRLLDWTIGVDGRISGSLPPELDRSPSSSVVVSGRFEPTKTGTQHHFLSDQLLHKNSPIKIPAHETMKEKPFFVELVGCDSELVATVHGVSDHEENDALVVCFYELGLGEPLGCAEASFEATQRVTADTAIARISLAESEKKAPENRATIFASVRATFPPTDGSGTGRAKHATVSDTYEPYCSY